ncbi:MAG: chromosomal replication initiator protein DnaA [Planctomycetota bacterium]
MGERPSDAELPIAADSRTDGWGWLEEAIQQTLGEKRFERWFGLVRILGDDGKSVTFSVPNPFSLDWIARHYIGDLERIVSARLGPRVIRLDLAAPVLSDSSAADGPPNCQLVPRDVVPANPAVAQDSGAPRVESPRPEVQVANSSGSTSNTFARGAATLENCEGLNDRLTLDSYIVGNCNHVAYSAGMEVLRQPGRSYNPLFIYGDTGLGKTHLIQGLTREYFRQGVRRIRYMPCESYVNRFIRALRENSIERFRDAFRRLRVLVLDDVHILQNKVQSQQELLHTIDAISSQGGQVILASDSKPQEFEKLQKQLQGRFVSGLVCRVEPPEYGLRLAILRNESRKATVTVPDSVLALLAESYGRNVRELTGSLVQVIAHATVLKVPVDERLTLELIQEQGVRAPNVITLAAIVELQATAHRIRTEDILSRSRSRTVSLARQEAIFLARMLTHYSLSEIGKYFGDRNHATANFAFHKVQARLAREPAYQREMELKLNRLRGRSERPTEV